MKLAVIANPEKYSVRKPFAETLEWAKSKGISIFFSRGLKEFFDGNAHPAVHITDTEEEAIERADTVIAIGGDGTMLYTARLMKNVQKPVLGVNSGRLGFMANTQQEQLQKALEAIHSGDYKLDRRHLLQATDTAGTVYHALNEFLFSKKDSTSMVTVGAEYDNMFINTYWADGLIVASPTGSTAYNLSSGGPIVMPQTDVMVLTPINPHTLTTRPLVLPSDKSLKITVEQQMHQVLFSYDGKIIEIESYPFVVEIKQSDFTVDLIELPGQNYFETLRNKLMWGMDYRKRY
jgi:NAD+ kinase